ncbi:Serine incorporator [Plasmodiophora brassicae]|uniref:Serine incorporator n=1 Tax=Plasmodiophora brassicae TaxID=37360 RepID=A0A0G4IRN9_PLABS|nr:hypothetical protein PBRA_005875 [Plasmodiophora brassicae]SPQ98307.1 unnamed protein product [Plasmodiophora brassicae]
MGAILSAPCACLGSCLGSCAATAACRSLGSSMSTSRGAKLFYVVIVFLSALLALLARYASGSLFQRMDLFSMASCVSAGCFQVHAAFRICIAMFAFFVIMGVMSAAHGPFHFGHAPLKLLFWLVLIVFAFLLPNSFDDGFAKFALGGAGVFLLLQIMVLISFSYDWNSSWTSTEERPWLIAVVVVSATLWFGSVVVTAFFYSWFAVGDACGFQQAVITVNLLAAVLYTALALSSFAPHGTLLTSSVMFAYNTFTMYGALSADPSACNRSGVSLTAFSTWGLVITAVTLCWSAFSLSRTTLFGEGRPALDVTTEADPPADAEQASQPIGHLDEEQMATLRFSNAQFHLLMALSSLYITMAVSGWATAIPNDESNSSQRGVGAPVMWVALTTTWATTLLYLWTLCAPRCLPDRDFGVDINAS